MHGLSEKLHLILNNPTEDSPTTDHRRIRDALAQRGYHNVEIPFSVLRRLYPLCRSCDFDITVSLALRENGWFLTSVEPGDATASHYGIAVDYGSTTIVMQLIDQNTGAVVAQVRETNGQVAYGTDILTRITYASQAPAHREALQRATVDTLNRLLDMLCTQSGIDATDCPMMVLSGNTTMIHLLLCLDAWTVFAAPYAPVTTAPGFFRAQELGIALNGIIYIVPAASNYIGGDITGGLLCCGLHRRDEIGLFFDIGTNGELVVGNKDWIVAGAGAAGPALEGYISRYGMRAQDGAIDSVTIHGADLQYTTIGNKKPIGICGSGIIDLLAQMRCNNWVNVAGTLNPSASARIVYLDEEEQYAAVYALPQESASGEALFFTQTDIMQYLDTKAAAYTMIGCLLDTVGCTEAELTSCTLTGAFSAHSNLESAITIGMFPDLPRSRYSCIANASLEGARLLLTDRTLVQEANALTEKMYCIQFASVSDFLVRMQAAKFIPHTDMERFPTIAEKLSKMPLR